MKALELVPEEAQTKKAYDAPWMTLTLFEMQDVIADSNIYVPIVDDENDDPDF
ncbi:MAG: hypothetical protein IJU16_05040 [Clostridia bacterium]|nr:hypothetical protein [Clostridia bacterium]